MFVRATVNSQAKFSLHTKPSEEPPQWCACPDATVPPAGPVLTSLRHPQSALFNFKSFLIVILLFICASTYLRQQRPSMFVEKKPGCAPSWHLSLAVQLSKQLLSLCALPLFRRLFGLVYKASVIGALLNCPRSLSSPNFFCAFSCRAFRAHALRHEVESIRFAQLHTHGCMELVLLSSLCAFFVDTTCRTRDGTCIIECIQRYE